MLQCFHCFAAKVATLWNGTNRSRSQVKIWDSVANSYGPDPVLMLATARNERAPMVKNSASSPPRAGSVDHGSKRPADHFQQQQLGIAVTPVHAGRTARDVTGELRDREQLSASHCERLDGARTGRGYPLHLGERRSHGSTTATAICPRQVNWSYYE